MDVDINITGGDLPKWKISKWPIKWLLLLCAFFLNAQVAQAQTTQYTNSNSGAIADVSCGTASALTRTFVVGSSFTVSDVNLGVLLSHTYRSDLRITLQSPSGTTVNLMTNVGANGQNLNTLFDDEGTGGTIASYNGNDTITAVPPYASSRTPQNPLTAFDGQNAAGTWTMVICDSVAQDSGTFTRADLYLSQAPTSYADLSLLKSVSNSTPAAGAAISYTLSVTNAATSPLTANSVTVQDALPAGVSFVSSTGFGSYNNISGVWTVGSIPPNTTRSITINVTVNASAGTTILNSAEISASSVVDLDSTPGNGATGEDDYATASFTVAGTRVAGTPPTFTCPAGTLLLDWDTLSWPTGTTNNSYALAGLGTVNFALSTTATWWNVPALGGQSPLLTNIVTGGLSPAQMALSEAVDFNSTTDVANTVITLPTAVPGVRFSIFDVDYAAGQFADRVKVTGSYNGATVLPILTNGIANYTIGNQAYGDALSADASGNGNVMVTFSSPVDTITIEYGNHSLAPANPGGQAISIHDISLCKPIATLSVSKISSVMNDGISATNPKAIPGATIRYCILVTNNGSATTTSVSATDNLPSTVTYVANSMLSSTSCSGTTTAEDDNATGTDESDPFGMSISGTTITGSAASLSPGASMAMILFATVN